MDIAYGPQSAKKAKAGAAVTIGAYDGVHLGHRRLLAQLNNMARERSLRSVVVTFDRHPATVVRPVSAPKLLTDLSQKLELLASTDVDLTVVVQFDKERASESAEDFVTEVLVAALDARLVVVGEDFHFGHQRRGNVGLLREMGKAHGFDVLGYELQPDEQGMVVSSTHIRELLRVGDVTGAARLLGRHHEVRGVVVHGDGRGASLLGFPTANVEVQEMTALPGEGIYACWYERSSGSVHKAAVSLGRRPTFAGSNVEPVLEAFLLDFDGDLYGEQANVRFVQRLRDDRRFDDVEQLISQMNDDVRIAGEVLEQRAV